MKRNRNADAIAERWSDLLEIIAWLWNISCQDILLLSTLLTVSGCLPILHVVLLQNMVDTAVGAITGTVSLYHAFLGLAFFLGSLVFQLLFRFLEEGFGTQARERMKRKVHERLLRKASRLPLVQFESPETYDRLHRAQQGLETSLTRTLDQLFSIVMHGITATGLLIYLGSVQWGFPLILVVGVLGTQLVQTRFHRETYRLNQKHTPMDRRLTYLSRLLVEKQSAAEIRLNGLHEYLVNKRRRLFFQMRDDRLALARFGLKLRLIPIIMEQVMYVLVITGVVAYVALGKLSIGHFTSFLGAAERFRDATMLSFGAITALAQDLRYMGDLLDYLKLGEEGTTEERQLVIIPKAAEQGIPTVQFEAVSFGYPGEPVPILKNVSFAMHPGERIALVGLNGAGKSTLVKLLLGLYRPTSGRILVEGQDLLEVDSEWWRSRTAVIFQDYLKYQLTVRENIGFGKLELLRDDQKIKDAAIKSGAAPIIEALPGGLECWLGKEFDEQGQELSLGQWQKLAIARAYIKEAAILLLDEPTSALDAIAEVEVYRQFHQMSEQKSVLFVSHRLGFTKTTDRILVLDAGTVIEQGSHAELMEAGGMYAKLYEIQSRWYEF